MTAHTISLSDKYDLSKSQVLLNGTQALVRLMLAQAARDAESGKRTAGYVTGYRGSPLGALDFQMQRASGFLEKSRVKFQPGLNEDLAATALWGSQQAELHGEGAYDGVFGLWYGKGPGVDRSGDVMRHANMAGTSPWGGVLMALGDDHTGESSTTLHQSDWALVDAYMPLMSPAGVQEVLDYGIFGFALSRFSGCWVGLKCMKDTIEATAVVDGDPHRMKLSAPKFEMPEGGLNIRLGVQPREQEAILHDYKRYAAEAFGHANRIDKRMHGRPGAKIGFMAAGKNWLDLQHALDLLGLDEAEITKLGLTTYKVGMIWPLDMKGFREWADGLDMIVVVEEKRKLLEPQAKEAIFSERKGRRVLGWRDESGNVLFPTTYALDPSMVAECIAKILKAEGRASEKIAAGLQAVEEARKADNAPDIAQRLPYFCAGCPHNSSTVVPEGSRAYAGIGCHYMAQWMDRSTLGYTHMGGEGANWIGEAPFSNRGHIFQNLGDGTYNHSGIQAIRAALASGVNITYKILFNDAVAMTGGQTNDGELDAARIAHELAGMGVGNIALVHDSKEEIDFSKFPKGVEVHERSDLAGVQRKFQRLSGVSAIVYVQTCAAEKRRRRKRGLFPDPDRRLFINTDICEGCGDCGVQSNCVAIVPVETKFGRKRKIDQSACNKDYSCLKGFCPSFVTVTGAKVKKAPVEQLDLPDMEEPRLPGISGTHNILITGVGGTGVVTIGAILAQAAQIDGKGVGMMEMAGLAQKGGAVYIHCRLANRPEDISAIRVATGEADALIGGDLVVSAGSSALGLTRRGRTKAVVNSEETITGEFTRNTEFQLPVDRMTLALQSRLGANSVTTLNSSRLATRHLGDSIFSNMLVLGAAWQKGLVPLMRDSILRAVELNGASVEGNKRAFEIGRWAVLNPESAMKEDASEAKPKDNEDSEALERFKSLMKHMSTYSHPWMALKYYKKILQFDEHDLRIAVAEGYWKVLARKDEYEVARLLCKTHEKLKEEFETVKGVRYHLAPPFLARMGADGRPKKVSFGPWIIPLMMVLGKLRWIRDTPLNPFRFSFERRIERDLIQAYEGDLERLHRESFEAGFERRLPLAVEIARLPLMVRGFGPVKMANARAMLGRRAELWEEFDKDREESRKAMRKSLEAAE